MTHSAPASDPVSGGVVRPPFDPELVPALDTYLSILPRPLTAASLPTWRDLASKGLPGQPKPDLSMGGRTRIEELVVPGPQDDVRLELTVLKPTVGSGPWPLIFHTHGGGMIMGTRHVGLSSLLTHVAAGSAVIASIEYRRAPEHPDPIPVTDCYTGLCWAVRNSAALEIDPEHVLLTGASAGGGLAAGTALMARDRGFPHPTHQVLSCPMLDDRLETPSAGMLDNAGVWDRNENLFGWTALLGERRGTEEVSAYAAPARATALAGLPRTFIDIGEVETFRDEAIDYAQRLSRAGVSVDLHVWGGGFHGFETFEQSAVSQIARATRTEFIRRALER